MRALVTGADGFIGSHLVELLCYSGHDVRALALYNSFNSWGWLETVDCLGDIEVVLGDVRDPSSCDDAVRGVDVVFHLASLIAIPYSYAAVDSYLDTNVHGTLNVCHAARRHEVARVVQTSTSEVYGTARYAPIDEAHPLQPQSPYSATKIAADALALSFHNAFELPLVVARPFNTYGPRQSARAVIPTVITQIVSGASTLALGDVSPRRDFNYVTNTCDGLLAVATAGVPGEVYNIGSGSDLSVGDVVQVICELMGANASIELDEARLRPEGSEVYRLLCDSSKLAAASGYDPAVSLRDGLARTIEWFAEPANLERYKTGMYVV